MTGGGEPPPGVGGSRPRRNGPDKGAKGTQSMNGRRRIRWPGGPRGALRSAGDAARGVVVPAVVALGALVTVAAGPAPAAAEGLPVTAPRRDDAVRFEAEIRPFLAANCTACHNEKITEGGLRLDSVAALVAGGDSGPGVVPGKGAESVVFLRASHRLDDAMPPADNKVGARNLSPEQLGLLERWIDEGAQAGPAAARGPIAWRPVPPGQGGVLAAALSADGRVVAAARGGRVSLFDTASGAALGMLVDPALASAPAQATDLAHLDVIQSLAMAPTDDRIATGSFRTVKLWRRQRPAQTIALADAAPALAVALAPAGTALAVGRADGRIVLFDAATGAATASFMPHGAAVVGLAFSADGGTLYSASRDGVLVAVTVADGTVVGKLARPGEVLALARVGDDRLAVAEADGVVRIWGLPLPPPGADPAAAPMPRQQLAGAAAPVTLLAAVPGQVGLLAAGGGDGTVRLWNADTGAVVHAFAHGGALSAVAIRPDGARLATVGTVPGVKIWDLASGQPAGEWKGDVRLVDRLRHADVDLAVRAQDVEYGKARVAEAEKGIEAAAAETKQSGEKLAAAEKAMGEKQEAAKAAQTAKEEAERLVTEATAAVPQAMEAQAAAVRAQAAAAAAVESATASATAFAAVAASSAGDAAAAETLKTFQAVASGAAAAKAAADQAVTQAAQQIDRCKARIDEMTKKSAEATKAAGAAVEAVKQAETAVTSASRAVDFAAQQTARANEAVPARKNELAEAEARAAAAGAARGVAEAARAAAEKPLAGVAWSSDGAWLVATTAEGTALLLGGQDGHARDAWDTGGEGRALVACLPAGRVLLAGGAAPAAVWQWMPTWIHERTIGGETLPPSADDVPGGPPVDVVTALAFSPDGTLVASGGGRPSRSGEIKLWHAADGTLAREPAHPHSDTVVALEFSRDGTLLASGGTDRFVKVHAVADGAHVKSFEGHTGHVLGVAWQAHGRRLASAGADNAIKVWDVVSGEQQRSIAGLKKEATALRFLPPGEELAAASGDPTVRIYNAGNGGTVRAFDGVGDFVQVLTAAPGWLAAGCQDGRLRIWSAADGKLVHTIEPAPAPRAP